MGSVVRDGKIINSNNSVYQVFRCLCFFFQPMMSLLMVMMMHSFESSCAIHAP